MRTLVFPLLSAMLGALAAIFAKRRVLTLAGLGLAPLVVFESTAGGFFVNSIVWALVYLFVGCVVAWFLNRAKAVGRPT